jgi:hypothetical protein
MCQALFYTLYVTHLVTIPWKVDTGQALLTQKSEIQNSPKSETFRQPT